MMAREAFYDSMILERWWYSEEDERPLFIYTEVYFNLSGRFSSNLTAWETGESSNDSAYPEMIFWADMDRPISVEKGYRYITKMKITEEKVGSANHFRISLFLLSDDIEQGRRSTTKVYLPEIDQKDDGQTMYAILPARSPL